jgi:hypothetical protein
VNGVVGQLLPLAVGVAISPVPIIAVILMLLAPKARSTGAGFLVGWLAGITLVTLVFTAFAGATSLGDPSSSSDTSTTRLVLGLVLLALAARRWRSRPAPGEDAPLPGWMRAVDRMGAGRAVGLGFALSALNPKNIVLCAGGGLAIAEGGLTTAEAATSVVLFVLVAACTVLLPVGAYLVAPTRMRGPLDELRVWLEHNNAAVMAVLLLVFGVVLVGQGVGGY